MSHVTGHETLCLWWGDNKPALNPSTLYGILAISRKKFFWICWHKSLLHNNYYSCSPKFAELLSFLSLLLFFFFQFLLILNTINIIITVIFSIITIDFSQLRSQFFMPYQPFQVHGIVSSDLCHQFPLICPVLTSQLALWHAPKSPKMSINQT